ncbi:BTB/POZ domain-containing protein 3-like isoform X2 [Argopecten irradians]
MEAKKINKGEPRVETHYDISLSTKVPVNDWQTGKSLSESLEHILANGVGSDVTFLVGAKRTHVAAHKLIISSRSPVFFAMFNGLLAEQGEVIIPDIKEEAFKPFLHYLYTDQIQLTYQCVVPVMSVARKYCVDVLVSACQEFLQRSLSPENACFLMEESHVYTEDQLMAACLQVIAKHPQAVLQSNTFVDLCPACLIGITKSDELAVDECLLYRSIIKWANKKCIRLDLKNTGNNKREVLGDILFTIRFPIMDQTFFLDQVCVDGVLTNDEVVDILMFIRKKKKDVSTSFSTKRRRMVYRVGNMYST